MIATFEIDNALMANAQELARQRNLSLQQVVELALQSFLEQGRKADEGFRLRKSVFQGNGLQSGIREGDWHAMLERIYEGQGE